MTSHSQGAVFEQMLTKVAQSQWIRVIKIPTGARPLGFRNGRLQLVPVKTPFDFVFAKDGRAAFFDAKSFDSANLEHGRLTEHQVNELLALERAGFAAGYVVHFRTSRVVRFFPASELAALKPRQSLKPTDGISLGTSNEINLNPLFENKGETNAAIDHGSDREGHGAHDRKQKSETGKSGAQVLQTNGLAVIPGAAKTTGRPALNKKSALVRAKGESK